MTPETRYARAGVLHSPYQVLGPSLRAGLDAGEVEVSDGDVAGLAAHVGAQVAGLASADEVLVTST